MFGLGPTELIVILVLALLVLGPQRIPEAASSLGKAIRSFRRATRELRDQIDIDDDVRRPFEDLRSALRDEPPPLPPPQAPSAGSELAGTAAGSSLVKPPVEPVLSQTGDAETAEAASSPSPSVDPHGGHRPARGEPPLPEPAPSPATSQVPASGTTAVASPASDAKPESTR
jgi:sec-independent protein translocase protein TatB